MSAPDLGGFLSPPLVGLAIAIVFGVLLFLTVNNPDLVLAFSVALTVFELSVAVLVLVFAFSESVGTGFLTLCVPCYVLYFVFGVCDNAWVRVLFGVSLLLRIISIIVLASTGTWEASGL